MRTVSTCTAVCGLYRAGSVSRNRAKNGINQGWNNSSCADSGPSLAAPGHKDQIPGRPLRFAGIAHDIGSKGQERRALLAEHAAKPRQKFGEGLIAVPAYESGNLDVRAALLAAAAVHMEPVVSPDRKPVVTGKLRRGHDVWLVGGSPSS